MILTTERLIQMREMEAMLAARSSVEPKVQAIAREYMTALDELLCRRANERGSAKVVEMRIREEHPGLAEAERVLAATVEEEGVSPEIVVYGTMEAPRERGRLPLWGDPE